MGGSGGHRLGEVGGGARYCGGIVQVPSLLVTHMGDGVSNNGGDSESSSNAVEGGLLSWSGTCNL